MPNQPAANSDHPCFEIGSINQQIDQLKESTMRQHIAKSDATTWPGGSPLGNVLTRRQKLVQVPVVMFSLAILILLTLVTPPSASADGAWQGPTSLGGVVTSGPDLSSSGAG